MLQYIARRLLWGVLLLFIASAVIFIIFYALPTADPAELRAGRNANEAQIAEIRENLGLDKPIYEQYFIYVKGIILHADFGYSYEFDTGVGGIILDRLPATIYLTIGAVLHLAPDRDPDRDHLGGPAPLDARPLDDDHHAWR